MKNSLDPLVGDGGLEQHGKIPRIVDERGEPQPVFKFVFTGYRLHQTHGGGIAGHHLCHMANEISSVCQHRVKRGRQQRVDFKIAGGSQAAVNRFAVGDLLFRRNGGGPHLLHAVGTVCIVVGKTDQPSVVQLDFMGGPGVQGQLLHIFHVVLFFPII